MKSSMKKLAVFVIIAAIAMFSTAAMAWDDDHPWKHGIQGDYAVTGGNTCIIAPCGFTNGVPNACKGLAQPWATVTGYWLAVFTFHPDGTGSVTGLMYDSVQPGPDFYTFNGIPLAYPIPSYGSETPGYSFTYTVAADGVITFTVVPCTYPGPGQGTYLNNIPLTGVISPDGESLIVHCGGAAVLLKVGTCSGGTWTAVPSGAALACNISLTGFRIPKRLPESVLTPP